MIGVEFEYSFGYKQVLNDLLKNIDFSKLIVNISQQEVIYEGNSCYELYGQINGCEFQKYISKKGNYFISYLNMSLYDINSKIKEIKNYSEFATSNCKLYILICDGMYYEIYFNENNVKNIVLNNLKELNINYTEKTTESDGRKVFWV